MSTEFTDCTNALGIWGNMFFRMFTLCKGEEIPCHAHEHRHVTFVCHGSVLAIVQGEDTETYRKGEACPVESNIEHGFRALEEGTVLACVHVVRESDSGEALDWDDALRLPYNAKHNSYIEQKYITRLHELNK